MSYRPINPHKSAEGPRDRAITIQLIRIKVGMKSVNGIRHDKRLTNEAPYMDADIL